MMTFYHASLTADITELNTPVVYLTTNKVYAAFYIRDMEVNFVSCGVTDNGIVVYDEWFPNQLQVMYKGMSGYIYSCADSGSGNGSITHKDKDIWISQNPVTVADAEYISDVYEVILGYVNDGAVKVNRRYETMSDDERTEFSKRIATSMRNATGKKAEFYKRYFPI